MPPLYLAHAFSIEGLSEITFAISPVSHIIPETDCKNIMADLQKSSILLCIWNSTDVNRVKGTGFLLGESINGNVLNFKSKHFGRCLIKSS
jgi:hypothetical protein